MDRSLSTIDTVWSTFSLSPPVAPRDISRSFSLSLFLSLLLSPRFIVSRDERKFKLENRVENELEFPRRLFQREIVIPMETWVITRPVDNRPWFNYAICQAIIFDPRFAGLSRFSRYAPITEINTVGLDLIAVWERAVVKFLILFDFFFFFFSLRAF